MLTKLREALQLARMYGNPDIIACLEMTIADCEGWLIEDSTKLMKTYAASLS